MKTGTKKINWTKNAVAGYCEISETRTQWVASTKFGSIQCSRSNTRCTDLNIWNTIIRLGIAK